MTTCCNNNLGEFPHNEDLNTGLVAEQAGEYKALLSFGSAKIVRKITLEIGEEIVIPKPFNEINTYGLQIIQPDGTKISVGDCENFSFSTYINITEPCGEEECEDNDSEDYY